MKNFKLFKNLFLFSKKIVLNVRFVLNIFSLKLSVEPLSSVLINEK